MFDNNVYSAWGFSESPFSSMPLLPNKMGESLLVGRDGEMRSLALRILNSNAAACLDGPVGAGKTSLANVVIYKGLQSHLLKKGTSPLLIPCGKTFQIKENESAEDFKLIVLMEVAQALVDVAKTLGEDFRIEDSIAVKAWLQSPLLSEWSRGAASLIKPNPASQEGTVQGLSQVAFESNLTRWLGKIFPEKQSGGVVCVIDNLELLEKSADARNKIENLRDTLFNINGIKWIFCGAHGILQGVVTSQRLAGYLQEPLPIKPLKLDDAREVFVRRIREFASGDISGCYLPLTSEDFHTLYMTLHQNLRNTLSYVEEYCLSIVERSLQPKSDKEKSEIFFSWMISRAKTIHEGIKPHAGVRAMELFYAITRHPEINGEFSPSDFEKFGFQSIPAFRPHVKTLETCGLVVAQKDDIDQRRNTISITAKGWLLDWYKLTQKTN